MTGVRIHLSPNLRQAQIAELVSQRGEVSVAVLARRFKASAETIRRDLSALADAGQVRKVHGGARAMQAQKEGFLLRGCGAMHWPSGRWLKNWPH